MGLIQAQEPLWDAAPPPPHPPLRPRSGPPPALNSTAAAVAAGPDSKNQALIGLGVCVKVCVLKLRPGRSSEPDASLQRFPNLPPSASKKITLLCLSLTKRSKPPMIQGNRLILRSGLLAPC